LRQDLLIAMVLLVIAAVPTAADALPTISYTALSDAARKAGKLARYENSPCKTGAIELGDCKLQYSVPETASAYDVIPIRYTLHQPAGERRAAVAAVAFEDSKKADGRALYDMSIPGNLDVRIDYLGSITADVNEETYIPLSPDSKGPVSPYPPFTRDEIVRSSTIRAGRVVWFKFRLTNTGDTIWDPEGFGACFTEPRIAKLDTDGNELWSAGTINRRERFFEYVYPGESTELWAQFYCPKFGGDWCMGLRPGSYRLDFRMVYRYHPQFRWWTNIWTGREFARLTFPFEAAGETAQTEVQTNFKITDSEEKMPGYVERFEEFMTAFRIYPTASESAKHQETIYLQVAPWTEDVVVKLMLTDPRQIAAARIPITITNETLKIKYNPDNIMVVNKHGREEPAFIAQAMPGMRSGIQLGPYPEVHLRDRLREMKDLGVNVIANTTGSWAIGEVNGSTQVHLLAAQYKYFYDVLARDLDMTLIGWSVYPPANPRWFENATPFFGKKLEYSQVEGGYHDARRTVDMGDPLMPEVVAAWATYNYKRWGDMWFVTKDGRVPVDTEDTWGWLRDDNNQRYPLGPLGIKQFQDWVKAKYGSIERVNKAWGSDFKSFDQIDPQQNQGKEGSAEGQEINSGLVYNNPDNVFHEWTPATEDWDVFRTELRMDIYRKANEIIRKTIPNAELALRTEGANLLVKGDPKSDSTHLRHLYYAQRRNALVYDVLKKADVLHFHSDYTTLPYTEEEWRQAMRQMTADGFIAGYVPQFDHMRDILLNDHYGREYKLHYGLDEPRQGMMIHCLSAAYPWWKATYEEGGAPGIIWSDYACDGFVTETQKRELRLLRDHFDSMEKP